MSLLELCRADLAWFHLSTDGLPTIQPDGWLSVLGHALRHRSYRAVLLCRLACRAHGRARRARARLYAGALFHSCGAEIAASAEIGPGLRLPHPQGVIVSHAARLGSFVTLGQQCTLGGNMGKCDASGRMFPELGDGVLVTAGAVIAGPIRIGPGCIVAANAVVVDNMPAASIVAGLPARAVKPVEERTPGLRTAERYGIRTILAAGGAPAAAPGTAPVGADGD